MQKDLVDFQCVSDSSVRIRFGGPPSVELSHFILAIFQHLCERLQALKITNLHPAYESLLVDFDPSETDPQNFVRLLQKEVSQVQGTSPFVSKDVFIPVFYGASGSAFSGEDLQEICEETGLSPEAVIELHTKSEYTVAFLGFAPGFPYLLGLPQELFMPRKKTPRLRIPAGSVALAGFQTGIYPGESPAGWQILGKTDVVLFDPLRSPASLLNPGDRVHFVKAEGVLKPVSAKSASIRHSANKPILKIENGGFFSTLQDLGRKNLAHLGISAGGAADTIALRLGNRLVGNDEKASAIEATTSGLSVIFNTDTWFAVTGAVSNATLDGQTIATWTSLPVCAGQRLNFCADSNAGLRSYLCVHGGFGVEEVLGSRSTFVAGRWGGWQGRCLWAGDELPTGNQALASPVYRRVETKVLQSLTQNRNLLRVTRGPQTEWFSEASVHAFLATDFVVSHEANRLGLRLVGSKISWEDSHRGQELVSEGIANGSIQVNTEGAAMVLFCEQQTTGGYPKIATVIRADWHRLGQLGPGEKVRFEEISLEEAWQANLTLEFDLKKCVKEF
jgi:KipI family sensor histidine kinase inhibitor